MIYYVDKQYNTYRHRDYEVTWDGFIYLPGYSSGENSIKEFLENVMKTSFSLASSLLQGQFFIVVKDVSNGKSYAFVDSSGTFHAYHSETCLSASFLELVRHEKLRFSDSNPRSIAEFLHWGNLHKNRTCFDRVKKLLGKDIFCLSEDGNIDWIEKKNHSIKDNPPFSFQESMEQLHASTKESFLSIDITGGVDSRLLLGALDYYGSNYELAISGPAGHDDVEYAKSIASYLGKKLLITEQDVTSSLQKEIDDIFEISDGLLDISSYHRIYQHQKNRAQMGYDLTISGAGGEIYKEFSWLHDFPFYHKSAPNWERFYQLRFCPIAPDHSLFTDHFRISSENIKTFVMNEFNSFKHKWNSQAYDETYFTYKWPSFLGRFITNNNHYVPCYAPYMELNRAQFSYHLKRRERMFNFMHRDLLSFYNPHLSKMPTTEGRMGLSTQPLELVKDAGKFVANRSQRLLNKISQKAFKKSFMSLQSPNHPDYIQKLRSLSSFSSGIQRLKEEGVLHPDLIQENVSDRYVGRIIGLYKFIEFLDDN